MSNSNKLDFSEKATSHAFEPVIGLELHVQLNTHAKLFCLCPNQYGGEPNQYTCPICLGHPGTLPVVNEEVVKKAVKIARAIGATINETSLFERKSYFYPDLPKAYQITQLHRPICVGGAFSFFVGEGEKNYEKIVEIDRIQIEEDAGKLVHSEEGRGESYIDLNRAGSPLCEIVSKPQIHNIAEAVAYFRAWRELLLYLDVSNANMQEGNLRCDVNVSMRPRGSSEMGVRAEIKNMNTFKGIEAALHYEVERQTKLLSSGKKVMQQTMLFDVVSKKTQPMREKEDAHDYRYFPDPDLVPLRVTKEEIESIASEIGELPKEKNQRFRDEFGLSVYDAWLMSNNKALANYYEQVIAKILEERKSKDDLKKIAKKACNWISTEVLSAINEKNISINDFPVSASQLGRLIFLLDKAVIPVQIAKKVFSIMLDGGGDPEQIVKEKGWATVSDESTILSYVEKIIEQFPQAVSDFRGGSEKTLGFLVGQAMKLSKGQVDSVKFRELLIKKIRPQ